MTESQNLLVEYVQTGSDAAFRKLVTRYVDLVYSTALRRVAGDTHRAEDVAQTVFVDLARTARTLANDVMLGGWLHRHTCFVAAKTMRGERRRQSRERQAVEMNALQTNSGADFSLVAPILDDAINELGEADRTAILLRFFEQHDFRSVGEALGSNEDAARMRVTRALDKLQGLLKRRGVTTSAATLSVALSASAVQAAPVGLAVTISTAAALAGTTLATTATATVAKAIAMTTLQKTIVTTAVIAAVGTLIYALQQQNQIRSLQQQQASLTSQVEELNRQRDDAAAQLAALQSKNDQLRRDAEDVLRLRAEVTQLRRQPVTRVAAPAPAALAATNSVTKASQPQIHITARFVTVPTEAMKSLGVWSPNPQGGSVGLMRAQQFKDVREALQGASDADVLGAPEVVTLNGRQAQFSATQAVPISGSNGPDGVIYTNVGVSLDVIPNFNPASASFDLELVASLTQLIGDASKPGVQRTEASYSVTLVAGQTVVLAKEVPGGGWLPDHTNTVAGPKSLLVFVTPTAVDAAGNALTQ
jgi:RNA polymerase sigma factor (sigma-70 family)